MTLEFNKKKQNEKKIGDQFGMKALSFNSGRFSFYFISLKMIAYAFFKSTIFSGN